jgi:hypothetical protein
MAKDLERTTADDESDAAERFDEAAPPYQSRFQLLFGVLLGVSMAAVVATVIVLAGNGPSNQDQAAISWAPWRPTSSDGLQAVSQIAQHVGQRYTLPSGHELVAVRGGPLELARLPVTIALQQGSNYQVIDSQGVLFNLCGLGTNCSIKEGKPSIARHLVLRREALELALYTFRYIKNVEQVVVILPPAPGQKPSQAMFFRRGDSNVGASLDRPLAATLPGPPPVPPRVSIQQQDFLNRLTAGNLFAFTPQEGGDAHIYLVLTPPPTK